jgi:hypothetical protein
MGTVMGASRRCILVAFAIILCVPVESSAYLKKNWTQKELNKEAETVVIATPIKTTETKDEENLLKKHGIDVDIVRLETTFKVTLVTKGDVEIDKEIVVSHYKIKKINAPVVENPPNLVEFRLKSITLHHDKERKVVPAPDYLLYLKKNKEGLFIPVSADFEAPDSVFEVAKPWSDPTSIQR